MVIESTGSPRRSIVAVTAKRSPAVSCNRGSGTPPTAPPGAPKVTPVTMGSAVSTRTGKEAVTAGRTSSRAEKSKAPSR